MDNTTGIELDTIYDIVNDLFNEGQFESVDIIIKNLRIERLTTTIIIAWLTTTAWAKSKLNNRKKFYNDCLALLSKRHDKIKVARLLKGLK